MFAVKSFLLSSSFVSPLIYLLVLHWGYAEQFDIESYLKYGENIEMGQRDCSDATRIKFQFISKWLINLNELYNF